MLYFYLKSAIRTIIKRKFYSGINIIGLAIGLSAFILIAMYVRHELSYDRHNDDYKQIYRVVRQEYTCSPPAMAAHLKENIALIEDASHFIISTNLLASVGDNFFTEEEYFWTDNDFFNILTIDLIQGDKESILNSADDIVISESTAKRYFGSVDPMGKTITVSRRNDYHVAGVFKDIPGNSHYSFDVVLPSISYFQQTSNRIDSWSGNYTYTYVKVSKGANLEVLNKRMVEIEKELTGWTPESGKAYEQYFFFQPISEIHLHSHRQQEVQVNGNIRNVYIFSLIALLILTIACINYINITTALAGERTKEVSIRKVLGVKKGQLIRLFLTESILIAISAIIFSLIITTASLPFFSGIMDRNLTFASSDIPLAILFFVILVVLVGLLTGIIPSRSISGLSALSIMKGSSVIKRDKWRTRDVLVLIQFTIAIVLIIFTLNIRKQISYISTMDPGYDKEQIISIRVFDQSLRSSIPLIKDELSRINNVVGIASSNMLPNNITNFTRIDWFNDDIREGEPISYNSVGYNFTEVYNIKIVEGRSFSKAYPSDSNGAFLLNEKAVKIAGWDSPLGMEITHWDGRKGEVVGIVKDFNFRSMHSDIAPLYLFLSEEANSYVSIKISGNNMQEVLGNIEDTFVKYSPGAPFEYSFFDEEFDRAYGSELRLGSIFTFFSVLAVILACLGLFGMSSFSLIKRTKEIGVRKVFGASSGETLVLLSRSFLIPVFLANILAWPLAYIAVNRWLEGFAYKSDISIWSFLLAALIVLGITVITVMARSTSISRQDPAKSLRYD